MTEQEKLGLMRFGCTLQPSQNLLYVKWADLNREQALAATILVRSIYTKCASGPLLCLALEISPTRALAHYCYCPFNLKNQAHRKYLSSLARTGQLHLGFLAGRKTISRDYQLARTQCKRINELCAEASEALRGCDKYRFADVVQEFENTVRISQFFERAISEDELTKGLESLRVQAQQVPAEKMALAHQIVGGIADVLKSHCGDTVRKWMFDLLNSRKDILALFDLQREFGDDYEHLVDFMTLGIAVNTEEEALKQASDWPSKLDAILKLFQQANASPEASEKVRVAIVNVLTSITSGRGLSFTVLQNVLHPFRALLPGQPGRLAKDYSREYEWKASGLTWTEVATKRLQEDVEVHAEFGGRDFDALTFEEKEILRNRIREGVRSYARRTGKPFPLPEGSD